MWKYNDENNNSNGIKAKVIKTMDEKEEKKIGRLGSL